MVALFSAAEAVVEVSRGVAGTQAKHDIVGVGDVTINTNTDCVTVV